MLLEFKGILERESASAPVVAVGDPANVIPTHIALLRMISSASASEQRLKITSNFLAAGMHLAFFKSLGKREIASDLPDTCDTLLEQ